MNKLTFIKTVTNFSKLETELKKEPESGSIYSYVTVKGNELSVYYKHNLSQIQIDAVSGVVNNFSNISALDEMYSYLGGVIDPFGEKLMRRIRAENILLGITQSGKTGEVLGFFNVKVKPNGTEVFPYSFEDAFESGSMYEIIKIIDYWLKEENVSQISHLSPFITPQRLNDWKLEIVNALS